MDDAYQQVLKAFLNDISPELYLQEIEARLKEKETLLATTAKNRAQLRKKMDDLIPLKLAGDLDSEHFAELYQPLVAQVKQLDKSLPELQAEVDLAKIQLTSTDFVLNEAKQLYKEWSKMLFPQKRAIVEIITESVTIRQSEIDIVISHLPSASKLTRQHNFMDSLQL